MDYSYFCRMKKGLLLCMLTLILVGCSQKVDVSKIDTINGYWQISKVTDADGNKKEYPINEIYDYFEIKKNNGFHKKVLWQPDGTFLVNDLQDKVKITVAQEKVILDFTSKYGSHTDELASISDDEMVLISKEKIKFYYKKVIVDETK
jgi:hypothetical protein